VPEPRIPATDKGSDTKAFNELSTEEQKQLSELKQRDASVRQEEETHARILGKHAGLISYEYVTGPDGRKYAVAGSVQVNAKIDSNDPEEARKVYRQIQAAATGVQRPSQQDRSVAGMTSASLTSLQGDLASAYNAKGDSVPIESTPSVFGAYA